MPHDNDQPLDGSTSAADPSKTQKSDIRRSSSDGGFIWGVDKLQKALLEKTPPSRKEEVIEGQYALPLTVIPLRGNS
jgi:hypothetical protein